MIAALLLVCRWVGMNGRLAPVCDPLIAWYDDYVADDPPFPPMKAPLWIASLLLLGVGAWIVCGSVRRRRR